VNGPGSGEVLVVGAGPTGLALALQAHDHGAKVRIVDRRPCLFRPSRALILHSRTLEGLRPLGVAEQILECGQVAPEADLHFHGRVIRARLANLALADTAFPHLTLVRQSDVEAVLANALEERGLLVERGTEVTAVQDGRAATCAKLQSASGCEVAAFDYVVGCDGQASTVREAARIPWPGKRYAEEVVLADLDLETDLNPALAHAFVCRQGILLVFALGELAPWRLVATRPAGAEHLQPGSPGPGIDSAELQTMLAQAGVDARATNVAWSARFPLQRRMAARFRSGRLFVAGDAAHASSPATGQGMNLGIQDALNLGWKLAFAGRARDTTRLLDSYERERLPVDRAAIALTHAAFWAESSTSTFPTLLRDPIAPLAALALPALLSRRRLVAEVIRRVSQLTVAYQHSPVSLEVAPRLRRGPRPGSRLGDATVMAHGQWTRLHTLLAQPGVQVLLHRDARPDDDLCWGPRVTVHRLTSESGFGVVAVRPDGYVGFTAGVADARTLGGWLASIGAAASG
jgi:2-polyprenyl-6-methoxyphenol hydroxylase-like FAD-dependent oxidoreductase